MKGIGMGVEGWGMGKMTPAMGPAMIFLRSFPNDILPGPQGRPPPPPLTPHPCLLKPDIPLSLADGYSHLPRL